MDLPHVRSLLFAPGSDARKLAKALSSGADGVVCDLEDAVAPPDKEARPPRRRQRHWPAPPTARRGSCA